MGRKGHPTKAQSQELTNSIVSEALKMFIARGYAATTIDDLNEKLSISKRNFHSRFKINADLFRSAANAYATALVDNFPTATVDERQEVEQLCDALIELLNYFLNSDVISVHRTLVNEAVAFPEIVPILDDIRLRTLSRLHPILRKHGTRTESTLREEAELLWNMILAPRIHAAAIGQSPCAVTDETRTVTRARIALFLRSRTPSDLTGTQLTSPTIATTDGSRCTRTGSLC